MEKQRWLIRFGDFVRDATSTCSGKDRPKSEYYYTVGHGLYDKSKGKMSPKAAAQFYLDDTRYGKLACTRPVRRVPPRQSDGNNPRTRR